MKFGPLPLDRAEGKILGHHIAGPDGRRVFRKGRPLTKEAIDLLHDLGRSSVYVAELEPGDVDEDHAAQRVAAAIAGDHLELSKAHAGRVNVRAIRSGVFKVDPVRLVQINECEGITVATLASASVIHSGDTVATVKVIPFAMPERNVLRAEQIGRGGDPLIGLLPLVTRQVALILSGSPYVRQRVIEAFERPLRSRVEALGSQVRVVKFIPLEDEVGEATLVESLCEEVAYGTDLILLAGETAIMDRHDIAPRAVERAGGEVICFGAPVDPGNLLMLAYLGRVPVLGAPGCARSLKTNIIDWVLPRLLAGESLSRADILALGHGGLLEDTPQRPMPRNDLV